MPQAPKNSNADAGLIGTTVGGYRILSAIGAGGMGEVYLAEDDNLRRPVAVKLLPAAVATDPESLRRFHAEARAASSLNHPHILVVFDFGEHEGRPFMVTEFVEGQTLRGRLASGAFAPREAIDIAAQVARALAAAHAGGIVHRDIKPENVIVRPDGYVKVLDFGLAKVARSDRGQVWFDVTAVTQPGLVLGTPRYMSPEQIRGLDVDARTDLWSLGVLLYEMVAGRPPFDGATMADITAAVLKAEPGALDALRLPAPAALARLVSRALAKDRALRFSSASDLLVELLAVKSSIDSAADRERAPALAAATKRPGARRSRAIDSLAVLPFVNGSGDPEADYFCDGVTETIIASLSPLPKLRVMARSTTFRYKGRDVDPLAVGRELHVRAVLTGRLTQRGERLSIALELVDVTEGWRLWGAKYETAVADIFSLEETIATEVSEQLRVQLTGQDRTRLARRRTHNVAAYQAYLRGRHAWNRRLEVGFRQAIKYFDEAIAADPTYALPYAGLADCYALLAIAEYGGMPPVDAMPKAKWAAQKALEIDEQLAEAHTSLAHVMGFYDWDWAGAEQKFKRAIELNPRYPFSHHWYALFHVAMGRPEEGIASELRAQELEPLSLVINKNLGTVYYYARQYDRAIEQYQRTLELDAEFARTHLYLGLAYDAMGRFDEAIEALRIARAQSGDSGVVIGMLGHALGRAGHLDEARGLLDELTMRATQQYVPAFNHAMIQVGLGDADRAFECFDRAFDERSSWLVSLNIEPLLDSIRDDPRFVSLVQRVGLPVGN